MNHPQPPATSEAVPSQRLARRLRRLAGKGTAWLVVDRIQGDYLCYWYAGKAGDHLIERARAATAWAAVDWGRARTPRVRIRLSDARTYWAGAGEEPVGYSGRWDELPPAPG